MAGNGVRNAVALLIFLWLIFGVAIMFTVGNAVTSGFITVMTRAGVAPPTWSVDFYTTMKGIFFTSFRFITWLLIPLVLLSSFIDSGNLKDYIIGSIATVMVTALVATFGVILWGQLVASGGTMIDYSDLSASGNLVYVQYFAEICTANMVAALLSFVWKKQAASQLPGGMYA